MAAVLEMLPPAGRVLDVGCGYGRIALPLAQAGYEVEGLDLSPELVEAARRGAVEAGVSARFVVGSMTALPHPDGSFDAVLCLWSAFHELLEEDEQVRAIAEMSRVLAPGAFALVEGPLAASPGCVDWVVIEGHSNPHYAHDERTYARVCARAGIERFEVYERDWAGRPRLFLRLERS